MVDSNLNVLLFSCLLLFFLFVNALHSFAPRRRVTHGHEDTVGQNGHHDEEAEQSFCIKKKWTIIWGIFQQLWWEEETTGVETTWRIWMNEDFDRPRSDGVERTQQVAGGLSIEAVDDLSFAEHYKGL